MSFFWEKTDWEREDKHLARLTQLPFRRAFPALTIQPGLQSIRGPRQIGKSSWLKSLLSTAVQQQRKCFFHSCEEIRDFKELSELLKPLRKTEIIFLDEICFVSEWHRAIKYFLDSGYNGAIVFTGSNAHDLRQGIDRMPGRWAKGLGEYHLLPMDFNEWMTMRNMAGWTISPHLTDDLRAYFRIGGFPLCLLEASEKLTDPVDSRQTYLRWLVGDIKRQNRQEIYLRELLGQLALTMSTAISLQQLAQKTQMMSYHTAQDYISHLEDCFALRTLYCLDQDTGNIRFKKQKKFYFMDPILFWIAFDWSGQRIPENWEERCAEMVAHEFLTRRTKRLGYLANTKGEVDFFSPGQWAIEIKWSPSPKNLSRAYLDFTIPKKEVWFQNHFFQDPHEL